MSERQPGSPTGKTHDLKTIADFAALKPNEFARMLPDFKSWHDFMSGTPPEWLASAFRWCDDGDTGRVSDVGLSFDGGETFVKVSEIVSIEQDCSFIVGQYSGPRLDEVATELPDGAKIKWIYVSVAFDRDDEFDTNEE